MLANPPTENAVTTNSAPSSASDRLVVARTCSPTSRCVVTWCATSSIGGSDAASTSMQDDLRVLQRLVVGEVDEQPRRPVRAPAADDRDPRCHGVPSKPRVPVNARRDRRYPPPVGNGRGERRRRRRRRRLALSARSCW